MFRGANISRLSNVAKNNFFFADLQTLPKCIRLYGGLNISRVKFSLVTPKTVKSAKKFSLEIFRLYGITYRMTHDVTKEVSNCDILWIPLHNTQNTYSKVTVQVISQIEYTIASPSGVLNKVYNVSLLHKQVYNA